MKIKEYAIKHNGKKMIVSFDGYQMVDTSNNEVLYIPETDYLASRVGGIDSKLFFKLAKIFRDYWQSVYLNDL